MKDEYLRQTQRGDSENNVQRIDDPVLKFEKIGKDSPWINHFYGVWVGSLKPFEFNAIDVYSNYDSGQYANFMAESGYFKLKGYTYHEDDPTQFKDTLYEFTGGLHFDLIQTKNESAFRE